MFASETAQAPGTSRKVEVQGRFLLIRAASAPIDISAPGLGVLRLDEGDSYQFSKEVQNLRLQVTNPNDSNISWQIEVSNDEIKIGKQVVSGEVVTTIEAANQIVNTGEIVVPAGEAITLIGADSTRQAVRIAIPDDQPGGIYWAAQGIGVQEGGWLGLGMVEYAAVSAEITARNRGASDVVVTVVPLRVAV